MRRPTLINAGFSIVELLVAITLGLILLAGVTSVFVNSKQGYRVQESSGRLQENGRFAMDYLTRTIRMADFWGGVQPSSGQIKLAGSGTYAGIGTCVNTVVISTTGITGYAGASAASGLGDPPSTCISSSSRYIAYSDVLGIRYANPDGYVTISQIGSSITSASSLYTNGKYYVRALPGKKAVIFDASSSTEVSSAKSSISGSESPEGALDYQFAAMLFYLRKADNTGIPTLYAAQPQGATFTEIPIADGVEMMKFEYGIDSSGSTTPNYQVGKWVAAGSVTDWSKVLAVRVSLIVRGDALDNYKDAQSYIMSSSGFTFGPTNTTSATYTTYNGSERYQRRLFVKEIQIRNRIRG